MKSIILNLKDKKQMKKKEKKQSSVEQLGHNYVYHFNEYKKEWFCIHRDSYLNYWSKNMVGQNDWTSGNSTEEAAKCMLFKNAFNEVSMKIFFKQLKTDKRAKKTANFA